MTPLTTLRVCVGRRSPCIWACLAQYFFIANALTVRNNVPFSPTRHVSGRPRFAGRELGACLWSHDGDDQEQLQPEQEPLGEGPDLSSQILLESCLIPDPTCKVRRMSSTDLAYIGDVVYELLVRSRFVWPSRRTKDLQNTVVALVRGKRSCSDPFITLDLDIQTQTNVISESHLPESG